MSLEANRNNRAGHALAFGAVAALALSGLFLLVLETVLKISPFSLYNSDYLHPYLIVEDLLNGGFEALSTWKLSPALYVFPDWGLAYFVQSLGLDNAYSPIIYGVILFLGYAAAAGAIAVTLGRRFNTAFLFFGLAYCTIWLAAVLIDPNFTRSGWLITTLPSAYVHTGAALFGLVCAALFLKIWNAGLRPWTSVALVLTISLLTFSDPIFLVWFVLPACIVCAIDVVLSHRSARARLALLMLAPVVLVSPLEHWLNTTRSDYLQTRISFASSARLFIGTIVEAVHSMDVVLLALLVAAGIMAVQAMLAIRKGWAQRGLSARSAFTVLLAGMAAATILAPLATGVFTHPDHWRYMLFLPVIVLVWLTWQISPDRFSAKVSGLLVFSGVFITLPYAVASINKIPAPSPLAACLESHNDLEVGLGDYWSSKATIFLTERRVHIVQIGGDGKPWGFNYNAKWYSFHPASDKPFDATFIVMSRLTPSAIEAIYGKPQRVLDCGGNEIWDYGRVIYKSQ